MNLSKKVGWVVLYQTLGQEVKRSVRQVSLWNKYRLLRKAWDYMAKQLTTIIEDTIGMKPVPYY